MSFVDFLRNYDNAVKRLQCGRNDEYYRIQDGGPDEGVDTPVFACKFAQSTGNEHVLALANEEGYIAIFDTSQRDMLSNRFSVAAHYNAIFDLAWMFGEMKLVSVSGDHTARLFDVSLGRITEERVFHGHTRSVKTVAFRKDDPAVFATGSRDGSIFIWDTRANTNNYISAADTIISNSHNMPATPGSGSKKKKLVNSSVSPANSVTSIVFQDDNTLLSCGAADGAIKVWDLRKNYTLHKNAPTPKCTLPYAGNTTRNGFSNLVIDPSGLKLYANCLDNNIYCYNIATYNPSPIMTYSGHQNGTFYIKSGLSADGRYLISGSSDNYAYIWNTNKSTPLVYLSGHFAEVTCVAWCQKGYATVVTCSDDMKHKIWRIHDDRDACKTGEAVPIDDKPTTQHLNTPSNKRSLTYTPPHSQRKKSRICESCQMLTPGSVESLCCQNCKFAKSSKRTATQAKLSPGKEPKKPATERTPRRLFEPSTSRNEALATILENSPEKPFSPTANLPNFVVDGEAPHLRNLSPKKTSRDWLTKMRTEQHLRHQMAELSNPTPPKLPKLSKSSEKPKKSASLLRFFRVTNNSSRTSCERSPLTMVNSLSSEYRVN